MRNNIILSFVLSLLILTAFDAASQRRKAYNQRKYGYKKSSSKKYSNYKGGRVGYSSVGNPKYMTIGVSVNANNYFGDITANSRRVSSDYTFIPSGFGITASKVLYPGIFARAGFNYGVIQASDFDTGSKEPSGDVNDFGRWGRNYHFRNSIKELSLGFEIDFLPTNGGARRRYAINPYAFVGVAVFHHAPKAIAPEVDQAGNLTGSGGEWVDLQSIGTEGQNIDSLGLDPYSKFQFSLPLGLGVKIKLSKNFDLNVELGFRYLFTDYLDDIGGNYADLDAFGDDYLARALSERGAEDRAELDGADRNLSSFSSPITGTTNVVYDFQTDPTWTGGSAYTHGNNYVSGNERANSSGRDFLVTTQIRLVYILDKKGASRGKFR